MTNIYVGNLDFATTEDQLRTLPLFLSAIDESPNVVKSQAESFLVRIELTTVVVGTA